MTKPPALHTDVMKIKRTESEKKKLPGERERKSEGPISQEAAGMCFDFHPEVGSESPACLKENSAPGAALMGIARDFGTAI